VIAAGVLRRVDRKQLAWLRAALDASRGKMVMAVLGHPLFAGGYDVSAGDAAGRITGSARRVDHSGIVRYAFFSGVFLIGSSRTRMPVAAWIAFTSAGASGGTHGSPSPPSGASDRMNAVVTLGASAM